MRVKQLFDSYAYVVLAVLGAFMLAGLAHVAPVSANTSTTNSANTLKVSPVRTDVEIKAGSKKNVKTVVSNLTKEPITVRAIQNDFVAGDERGTPALILDEDEFAPTHSLKRFMKPIQDITIPAGESREVPVLISVPKGTQAGGYFGAVRFAPSNPDDGGQVNLSASVASLILLTVPGPTIDQLNLTNFDVQQDGKTGTNFRDPKNLQLALRFVNEGNLQVSPMGKIAVKQGDKVLYEADFNTEIPRDVILPDSARRWDVPLKNVGELGHYDVTATFTYGTKNKTIEVTKSFWVIPFHVIIAVIAGLLILIALIVGIWLFLRNYKQRILRGSRRGRGRRR